MQIRLPYGRTGLTVELPEAHVAAILNTHPRPPLPDQVGAVAEALQHPIGTEPLGDLARRASSACIVVCDVTRPVPNRTILPPLLDCLESHGLARQDITLLIATGTHRPNEGPELEEMIGAEVARCYRVVNHNARADEEQQYVGDTRRGVAAYVDRVYVQSDLKIITGLVEPHFMAGYSGGRKVVCPGITSLKTVHTFHSPALLEDPRADNGILEGNPCHEMALDVARLAGVDFSVNVVIDENRLITGVFAGELEAAHAASVEFADTIFKVGCPEPVDIVVTTNAGYPLDTTFYQAVKGLVGALPILKDGGTIVCASSLSEGIGSPEFTQLMFEMTDVASFMEKILTPGFFVKDQWEVEMLCRVLRKAEVYFYSDGIPREDLARCMVTPVDSVEEGVARALAKHGPHARIAVIPPGPYLIPYLKTPSLLSSL